MLTRLQTRLIPSLLSAVVGWASGVVVAAFLGFPYIGSMLLFAVLVGLYSAPVILLIWVFSLWPLYTFVPRSSVFWRPMVCVVCGMTAGGLLEAADLLLFGEWELSALLLAGPLIGGVTCAAGCRFNTREPDYIKPPSRPPFRNPALRLGHWLARQFSE